MIMKNHKLVLVLHDYCQDSLKTGRNFSISKLRTALPSFFYKAYADITLWEGLSKIY